MSVPAITVINEAALAIGNPDFSRVTRADWRGFLNQSARDLARKLNLVLVTAVFDIEDGADEYAMPSDLARVKRMRWNDDPANNETWRVLGEMFEDEFDSATDNTFASGDPCRYFARTETFHLYPRPDRDIVGGGKIIYWGMPDEVTDESTQAIPVMDILRDPLRERMVIYGLRRLDRFDKAAQSEKEWEASLTSDRDRLEDRSADRRPRMRPRSGNIFGQR